MFDDDGVPLAGAKYRFYDAASHATPKNAYTSNALTTSFTFLTADSGGNFAQAYAAQNSAYYVTLEDQFGVPVAAWDNITGLGGNSASSFDQTFADARWKVSSGLIDGVNLGLIDEAGFPSPTNTGGNRRMGGWAGSQGTKLVLDYAAIATTGSLTILNGKKLPGVVLTDKTAFSAVSTVDITLPATPAGVRAWRVELFDVVCSAGSGDVRLRLAYGGGAVKTGATDYASYYDYYNASGPSYTAARTAAAAFGAVATLVGVSGMPIDIDMNIRTVPSGTGPTIVQGVAVGLATAGPNIPGKSDFVIYGLNDYGKASTVQIFYSSGTLTGSYRVVAEYGFGE